MARMRAVKQQLKDLLSAPDWRDHLSELRSMGQPAVGPLFSFLLLEPLMRHKAALALGQVVAGLEEGSAEDMHNIMRRLMWHMNEESGNIGWGIPEAFGEVLAACPRAAKEFHRVLISYVIDLGRDAVPASGPSAVWRRPGGTWPSSPVPGCSRGWRTRTFPAAAWPPGPLPSCPATSWMPRPCAVWPKPDMRRSARSSTARR